MIQNTIKLESINKKLSELHTELISYAKCLEFEEICEFTLDNCKSIIPWNDLVFSGVYLIEIKNNFKHSDFQSWVYDFRERWEDVRYKTHFVSNLRNIRIKEHKELKEWIPIYIGKSRKIKTRINEHIFKSLGRPTFALKLFARENMREETFRLSVIKVENENYDWIMPLFEKTLRNKINPIIGRQ